MSNAICSSNFTLSLVSVFQESKIGRRKSDKDKFALKPMIVLSPPYFITLFFKNKPLLREDKGVKCLGDPIQIRFKNSF